MTASRYDWPMLMFCDKTGKQLFPGDYIVYGHALGRCAGLRYGVVLDIVKSENDDYGRPGCKLHVQGVDDDWGERCKPVKPGYLQFPKRVLKVALGQIPENVRTVLKARS